MTMSAPPNHTPHMPSDVVPLAQVHAPPSRAPPPPSSSSGMEMFGTITSSSRPPTRAATPTASISTASLDATEDDYDMLPEPAARTGLHAGAHGITRGAIFKSKELESLACSCEPDEVAAWDITFLAQLKSKSPAGAAAHKVLLYTAAEFAALPADVEAVARAYDVVLGGHLLALIQADTQRAKLVRSTVAEREADAPGTVASSGRAVRGIILELISPTCGSELQSLEDELAKPFFTIGMNEVAVKLAARRLKALREQLPASSRGGKRELLRALIEKFPAELSALAKKYKASMCEAEVCKLSYKWTYGQLSSILASHITSSVFAEANATDVDPRRHGGGSDASIGTAAFKGCLNCGLDNHTTWKCSARECDYCGLRFCFGVRKRGPRPGCLVKKIVTGGSISDADIVGLDGKPLKESLVARIKEKAADMLKAKSSEVNAAGVQTEPNVTPYMGENDYAEESD